MPHRRWLVTMLVALVASAAAVANASASPQTWSAAGDFSATSNPNGQWSYQWSQTRGSALSQMTTTGLDGNGVTEFWEAYANGPVVDYNPSSATQNPSGNGSNTLAPHALLLAPGSSGENAVVVWTAPASGIYDVAATFTGIDKVGTTTDVAVLDGTSTLWSANVNGYADSHSFQQQLTLNAGDTIDFTVGDGGNGYYYDSTGLDATVTAVDQTSASASAGMTATVLPTLSIALDKQSLDFGQLLAGGTATQSVNVTVGSNDSAGYSLVASRTAFTPHDLLLSIACPSCGLASTAVPTDSANPLQIAQTGAPSADAGDSWATSLALAVPANAKSGNYSSTLTFTAVGR